MGLQVRVKQLAKGSYRQRLSPRLRRRFWHLRQQVLKRVRPPRQAGLSVVMPVYNVESYLAEAVDSVLSQSYRNLELILVDDGSTDASGRMCDEFAAGDPRVRVIHKKNAGLGAARNAGIAATSGEYLAFVDSDDYLLPDAYTRMIASLQRTGSDVVTGNVMRRDGKRIYQSWLQSRSHLADRTGLTLAGSPELLFDTVAWNKVYGAKFWKTHVKTFPVDKLYEDTATVFTALLYAKAIDVLIAPVYVWRLREERDSITQRLLEPDNIDDRFEMLDHVDEMIREHGLQDALSARLIFKILEVDLWVYVRELNGASDEAIDRVQEAVRRYWPAAPEEIKAILPPERRVAYWLAEHDRAREVPEILRWYASVSSAPPLRRDGGRLLLDVSDCPLALDGVPDSLLDLAEAAPPVANITALRWTGATTLTVSGYAYTRFVSDGSQRISVVATNAATRESIVVPGARTPSVESALWASDLTSPRDHDGFSCDVDVAALWSASKADAAGAEWSFAVRVEDGAVVRTIDAPKVWKVGSGAVVGPAVLPDRTRAIVTADTNQPIRITFDDVGVFATSVEVERTAVTIRLDDPRRQVSRVWLTAPGAERTVEASRRPDGSFTAVLPCRAGDDRSTTWRVLALTAGEEVPVLAPPGVESAAAPNPDGLRAVVTRLGHVVVTAHPGMALVSRIGGTPDGEIEVSGALLALDAVEIGLAPRAGVPSTWHQARVHEGRFDARIPTTGPDVAGVLRPLASGNYLLHARRPMAAPGAAEILMTDAVALDLPVTNLTETIKARIVRREPERIGVEISAPVPDELLGQYAQAQLKAQYGTSPRALEDAVFFQVDLGSTAADSALAIHQELRDRQAPLKLYWGVQDLSVAVPDGGIPVVKRSEDWFAKLNGSRYLVNNYGGFWGLSKDPGQRYLQTWHGTPLKFIGVSEARHKAAPISRYDQIANEAAEWDAFTSPSPYFSALVPTEFSFTGTVLETGYPRNDRLATASAADRDAIRARLGIAESDRVMLYAPTFREGMRDGFRADLYDGLDASRLATLLGPSWRILLRGHSFNARDDHADRSEERISDVTRYPDVNDLYLVADVLVTDYSSVMFDFSVTGKPMAFFTPDLKQYVTGRGTYFDLEADAPGPLYADIDHLADALHDLDALSARYQPQYEAFREKFAPWDDGKAAARVVDAFFLDPTT